MLPLEARADFLKSVMLEDRNEIRIIRDRIYQLSSLITVSSFAITAFLARGDSHFPHSRPVFLAVDSALLMLLWVSFVRLKTDLYNARKALEAREDMIRQLGTDEEKCPFDPFPPVEWGQSPRIKDRELYWVLGFATVALIGKLLVVSFTLGT